MTVLAPANRDVIAQAAALLRAGGIVGFPTETYYGLAVDPLNPEAIDRLFRVKQRSRLLPLLVLVQSKDYVEDLVGDLPANALRLIAQYWPGPLTLVCPARPELPPLLTGGTGTIGFRQSSHPVAAQLVTAFGGPVTATSANTSGAPAAVTAAETVEIFGDALDLVLDGGTTPGGSASTLVACLGKTVRCLREGPIPFSEIQHFLSSFNRVTNQKQGGGTDGRSAME